MRDDEDARGDDDLLPRLFRALGTRPVLPEDMRRNWEAQFGRELSRHNAMRRRRLRRYIGAAGAGLAVLLALGVYLQREATVAPAAATVVMIAGEVVAEGAGADVRLQAGDELRAGQAVHVGPHAYLALRLRGTDVRANSNTVLVPRKIHLQLVRGELYVDAPPTRRNGPSLMIETSFAVLTHIGTQFLVSVTETEMRTAVREGAVAIDTAGQRRTLDAADGPMEVAISSLGIQTPRPIAGAGGIWNWVVAAAPEYPIDGRSADEFFVWATRQLGVELQYATEATRVHARLVVLHGGVRGMSVTQGLDIVAATTDLDIDQSDPTALRVQTRTR
jgi:FecR protein